MTPRLITELGLAIACLLSTPKGEVPGYITLNRYEIQRVSGDTVVTFIPVCRTSDISGLGGIDIEELEEWQLDTVESLRKE